MISLVNTVAIANTAKKQLDSESTEHSSGLDRGVTRLNGARGKKRVWRPLFEPEVFRKQMYCIRVSTCDIFGALCTQGIVPSLRPWA